MPFVFLAILVGLSLSPPFRKLVIGLAVVLIAYIAWDNLVTETIVGPNTFEVQESKVVLFSEPSMDMAAQLKLQIANNSSFELESVDAVVTLDNCPTPLSSACESIGRQSKRIQLLAPPRTAKRAEAWVYFTNLPTVRGSLVARVKLVGGVADRF